jgi:hypothetical protein
MEWISMKTLKKVVIIKLILLFSLIGCIDMVFDADPDMKVWSVVVVNKLPYSIYAIVEFDRKASMSSPGKKQELFIKSEKMAFASRPIDPKIPRKAHRGIKEILVFSEDKTTPLIILRGQEMDKYVIHVGDYWIDGWQFCLGVNEENIGVFLSKGIDFEEIGEENVQD